MNGTRLGVDIGGTFTDIVVLRPDGAIHTRKIPSTVDDYARGIIEGVGDALSEIAVGPDNVDEIRHGTTVASNAILERKGPRTGLITTKGFRDILEIRTLRMPRLYDMAWEKPPVLVPRHLRVPVDERLDARGEVLRPLTHDEARNAVQRLLDQDVESIAVCLLHSYANPVHELILKEAIERLAPGLPYSLSFDVLPEVREYERTSTTVLNAYLKPIVGRYLQHLEANLSRVGMEAPVKLMQSSGGLTTVASAAESPVNIVESGPAAGVVGAQSLAVAMGLSRIITLDMGGTTAKASLVEEGEVTRASEYQVGAGIMVGSRLLTGGGYTLKVPAIDLAEVGAGGGSVIWCDSGGSMQVGPLSAGAMPGPACYDQGGLEPTVTDANVVLGYLNPRHLAGGSVPLNPDRARAVLHDKLAVSLSLSVEEVAFGAYRIAASNMIRAIKAVSSERGRDPRDFSLFAFGGNGPLFAATMARTLGIRRCVIPPVPGVFSAFGLLQAAREHHYRRSFRCLLRSADLQALNTGFAELEGPAQERLQQEGFASAAIMVKRHAALRYQGQTFELTIPVPSGEIGSAERQRMEADFGQEHERTYGHRAGDDEPVEVVTLEVVATAVDRELKLPNADQLTSSSAVSASQPRPAYFGTHMGWLETPILQRKDLVNARQGPLIIEEYDATCLVPPDAHAALDRYGNIVIELEREGEKSESTARRSGAIRDVA